MQSVPSVCAYVGNLMQLIEFRGRNSFKGGRLQHPVLILLKGILVLSLLLVLLVLRIIIGHYIEQISEYD